MVVVVIFWCILAYKMLLCAGGRGRALPCRLLAPRQGVNGSHPSPPSFPSAQRCLWMSQPCPGGQRRVLEVLLGCSAPALLWFCSSPGALPVLPAAPACPGEQSGSCGAVSSFPKEQPRALAAGTSSTSGHSRLGDNSPFKKPKQLQFCPVLMMPRCFRPWLFSSRRGDASWGSLPH